MAESHIINQPFSSNTKCEFIDVGACADTCNLPFYLENTKDVRNDMERYGKWLTLIRDAAKHGCPGAIKLLNEIEKGDTIN